MPRLAPTATEPIARQGFASLASHLGLLALSAVLLGLSFPWPGWSALAHVALVPMVLLALRSSHPWRLAWTAYLIALAWWLVMARWLIEVTGGGWFALQAYMAIYTPAALLLLRWLHQRYRSAMVLTLPFVWVSFEFIRCNFPQGGFGWFALGHSQAPFDPSQGVRRLIQIADLFGQSGVSFLVAMTNGLIVDLLTRPLVRTAPSKGLRRTVVAALVIWLLAFGGAWGYGYYRTRPTSAVPGPRVAVIQTNVPQDNKEHGNPEQMLEDWRRMVKLTFAAAEVRPDLIVWPETMVPAALNPEALAYYETAEGPANGYQVFHEQIQQIVRQANAALLAGAPSEAQYKLYTISGGQYELPALRWNSAYLYRPDGVQERQRYDKIRRVPFGEYLPWIDDAPFLKGLFMKYLSPYGEYDYTIQPGSAYVRFDLPGPKRLAESQPSGAAASGESRFSFAAPICFEDVIPSVTRRMIYDEQGRKQANFLVNISNDGWYPGSAQGPQHLQIAVLRCVENRVPMARSVNTGISGFVDANGVIGPLVVTAGRTQQVEGWAVATLTLDPRATLFGLVGHLPVVGLIVATAALAVGGAFRRKK